MPKKLLQLLCLITAVACLSACQIMPEEESLPPMPIVQTQQKLEYETTEVMRGDLVSEATVRCTYELAQDENLSFSVSGLRIDQILVEEGQSVKAGDLLITSDQESLQAQLDSHQHEMNVLYQKKTHLEEMLALELSGYDIIIANLNQELKNLQETPLDLPPAPEPPAAETTPAGETVPTTPVIVGPTYEEQVAALQQQRQAQIEEIVRQIAAQEAKRTSVQVSYNTQLESFDDPIYVQYLYINELKAALEEHQIFAGIDGVVTYVWPFTDGQQSVKNLRVITISDLDSAVFTAKTEYAEFFPVGEPVTIICQKKQYKAHVVDPVELGLEEPNTEETNEERSTIYFTLDLPDPTLANGVNGTITLALDRRPNVLYLSKDVIKTTDGKPFVYLQDENGLRIMQPITTGLQTNDFVEITSGLQEGDRVIVDQLRRTAW